MPTCSGLLNSDSSRPPTTRMLVEINGYSVRSFFRFSDQTSRLMHRLLIGLVNGAPYLCCAVLGCWLTSPLNNWLGRRGTIFLTAALSALTCIWMGVTNSWQHLFAARCVTVPSELPRLIDTDLFSRFHTVSFSVWVSDPSLPLSPSTVLKLLPLSFVVLSSCNGKSG